MVMFIEKWKGKRRIPQEVYNLLGSINPRYSQLDLNGGDFKKLSKKEKLSKLIKRVNNDSEIKKLNSLSRIGAIGVFFQGNGHSLDTFSNTGFGKTLCVRESGLHIHSYDDYKFKYADVPATVVSLKKTDKSYNAERLKEDVVNYTDKDNYIKLVVDYGKFK